ncbi:MAG: RNA methyltransferase, partial [Bacteroidia bacterium]|nr:RNA methyltransferase [Bacteroidia bacterium]
TAVVFGNELRGLSDTALQHADQKITIPMVGFTESLNISVSVAITLTTLFAKVKQQAAHHYLSQEEKERLRLDWYRKIVRRSELIEREFLKTIQ